MNVILACNAGMSTGILCIKIAEEAKARGVDLTCTAVPKAEIRDNIDGADAILLGPQIRFAEAEVKGMAGDRPVLVISAPDFGLMNAKGIVDQILAAVK